MKSYSPGNIYHADCVDALKLLPDGLVDLAFADPPFNIGYDYDVYDDGKDPDTYLGWCKQWMSEVHRVLKPDGTFWLAIGDEYAAELKVIAQREIGFRCRSWVVWYYTFGVNCKNKFTRSHAHLFYFVKNEKRFTFRGDELENRIPSARQLVYADRRANPAGRLPDDTWIIAPSSNSKETSISPNGGDVDSAADGPPDAAPGQGADASRSGGAASSNVGNGTWILRPQDLADRFTPQEDTWYFPRVAGTFKEREGFHGCQMPEQLLGRIIRTCSNPGELVLDPFSGSATTLAVAKKLGRQFLGFDLSPQYVKRGLERLAGIKAGDALDGSPEPTMSAPSTANGKRRSDDGEESSRQRARRLMRNVSSKRK
jgi:site-specific DNA-methyltransferase (adenine-specific)